MASGTKYLRTESYTGDVVGMMPMLQMKRHITIVISGLDSRAPIFVFSDKIPAVAAVESIDHMYQGLRCKLERVNTVGIACKG